MYEDCTEARPDNIITSFLKTAGSFSCDMLACFRLWILGRERFVNIFIFLSLPRLLKIKVHLTSRWNLAVSGPAEF